MTAPDQTVPSITLRPDHRAGDAVITGTGVRAATIAIDWWESTGDTDVALEEILDANRISYGQATVAFWYAARSGALRRPWRGWADEHAEQLWRGNYGAVPPPPRYVDAPEETRRPDELTDTLTTVVTDTLTARGMGDVDAARAATAILALVVPPVADQAHQRGYTAAVDTIETDLRLAARVAAFAARTTRLALDQIQRGQQVTTYEAAARIARQRAPHTERTAP